MLIDYGKQSTLFNPILSPEIKDEIKGVNTAKGDTCVIHVRPLIL